MTQNTIQYTDVLKKLYQLTPAGMKLGLNRVRAAAETLGSPHNHVRAVQIAGTNGKGSVAIMLEAALRGCGLTTGLFTSPHLHRFTERIRLNGCEVNEDLIALHLDKILSSKGPAKKFDLSFFEVATLAALCIFNEAKTDIVLLEVGLGGRLDATSIVSPIAEVITSIGLDHTEILGNSIELIAAEKAAIAKSNVPIFTGRLPKAALKTIRQITREVNAPLFVLGQDFHCRQNIKIPWPGEHQRDNAAVASTVFKHLSRFDKRLNMSSFDNSISIVNWPGRFEIIDKYPRFILDGAHNVEAVDALVKALKESGEKPDIMIFGALFKKPFVEMYKRLESVVKTTIVVPPPLDRAFDHRAFADRFNLYCEDNVARGLDLASRLTKDQPVLITGSFFTIAEARRLLLNEQADPPVGL